MTLEENNPVPVHAIEVRISVGAHEPAYLAEVLREMAFEAERGELLNGCSGGWGGSWSVTIARRDVTAQQYRAELEEWAKRDTGVRR